MRKKLFTILIIFAFLSVSAVSFASLGTGATTAEELPSLDKPWDIEGIAGYTRDIEYSLEGLELDYGNTWWIWAIDDTGGYAYWQPFECIINGTYGNIWVGMTEYDWLDNKSTVDPTDDTWHFSYPWSPDGYYNPGQGYPDDYYLQPGYVDTVTYQDLEEVLFEFDNNIHDTDVANFGNYSDRPGPFGDNKTQILVFNIRDDWFYDPYNALGFIEGYFWSVISDDFHANAFHMDTFQWWRRQGETPPMVDPYSGFDYSHLSVRAWEYEGTFAHEFQHLIHHDVDSDELSWVNEGASTFAEYICGYGFSPGHISEYLLWFWDTSLVIWEGYLANYGAVFLWTFYMYEHYGGAALIKQVCQDPANGIAGWMNALVGITEKSFDELFQDWAIANYLDNIDIYGGIYGYYELEIGSAHSEYWDIPSVMYMWETGNPDYFDWLVDKYPNYGFQYAYGSCLPYVVNYVEFTKKGASMVDFTFDGDDYTGAAPNGDYNWHSDGTAWSWFRLGRNFDIPSTGATLTYLNFFSIEEDWDYGYVEVYDNDTGVWTTLPGLLTTTTLDFPQDNPYVLDNEMEPLNYSAVGRWNAFTGDSGDMYTEVMDLTPFAGHNIDLYFTYWTDGYTEGSGWYIDDIAIPELSYTYDAEVADPTWTVNSGWYRNNEIVYNNFEASFINIINLYGKKTGMVGSYVLVESMDLDDDTEEGNEMLFLVGVDHMIDTIGIFVVANQPGYEHTFRTSYSFEAHVIGRKWRW